MRPVRKTAETMPLATRRTRRSGGFWCRWSGPATIIMFTRGAQLGSSLCFRRPEVLHSGPRLAGHPLGTMISVQKTSTVIIDWLSSTSLSQLIQTTSWAIPGIQVVHIICLATLFALALNLALRIAGLGLAAEPLASLAGRFVPAMWICLVVLLLSGALLIIAEPFRTITNPVFYLKMSLLMVAIALTFWLASVARRRPEKPAPIHVAVATLSMLIWAGIIVAGRYIAYTEQ